MAARSVWWRVRAVRRPPVRTSQWRSRRATSSARGRPAGVRRRVRGRGDAVEAVDEGEGALAVGAVEGGAAGDGSGALHEQVDGVGAGQRGDRQTALTGHVQRLPAGGEDAQAGGLAQQDVAEHRARVDQVFAGVEDDQHPPPAQMFHDGVQRRHAGLLGQFQHAREGRRHQLRVVQGRQLHQPHPVGEPVGDRAGRPQCRTALADATGTDQRHQPGPCQLALEHREFLGASDEAGQLHRELTAPPLSEAVSHAAPIPVRQPVTTA